MRIFLVSWPGLQAAHFTGDMVTFMFDGHREDQVERLKTITGHAVGIIRLSPMRRGSGKRRWSIAVTKSMSSSIRPRKAGSRSR